MIRSNRLAFSVGVGVAIMAVVSGRDAFAIKQFFDEFKAVYVKDGSPLAAAVDTERCNVCHVGKNKKDRNAYGNALAERLDKKEDKENTAKIRKVLEEVAALPSDSAKPGSPTFGDLLKDGKLPGGAAK